MSEATPVAKIDLGGEVIEREVCEVRFRTSGNGKNHTVTLAGGIELTVGDETASAAMADYLEARLKEKKNE